MGSMVMGFGSAPPQARFEGVFLSRERFQIIRKGSGWFNLVSNIALAVGDIRVL